MEPGLSVFIVQEKETGHTEYIKLFLKLHDLGLAGWDKGGLIGSDDSTVSTLGKD